MNVLARSARRVTTAGLAAALALVVTPTVAPAAPASAPTTTVGTGLVSARTLDYTPRRGAIFNRPMGSHAEEMRIYHHLHRTIDSTPRRARIRIAVFSFSRVETAKKLIAAHRRGVHVKVIVDDQVVTEAQRMLMRSLGTNPRRRSFLIHCTGSCRGDGNQMHSKFFTFTQAGHARDIVMVGSNNLTTHNAVHQWSDVYTHVGNGVLFDEFTNVFNQMKYDRTTSNAYQTRVVNRSIETHFLPYSRPTPETDPILAALSNVQCLGPTGGTGYDGHTVVEIAMYAWNGTRGVAIADKVAELVAQECIVKVIYGPGTGRQVKNILAAAGVRLMASTAPKAHIHGKYMIVNGSWGTDTSSRIVWLGSQNWTNRALRRDEVTMKVKGLNPFQAYRRGFAAIWRYR